MSRFNRFFVRWLSSPFGAMSGRAALVRYVGRRTGLTRRLPVNPQPIDGGFLIRVGRPEAKTWWRNFTEPRQIELVRGPHVVHGIAVVVPGSTGRGQSLAATWFSSHHGAAKRAGLPRLHEGEMPTPEALQAAAANMIFVVVTPG